MKTLKTTALSAVAFALAAFAAQAGDPAAGESAFTSQCQNCHNVVNDDGDVLAGRPNTRTGPNLYAVFGRQAGTVDGFRYGGSLVEAGEEGLVWDTDNMVPYLLNPQDYLREVTGDRRARSQMSFRVRDEGTANDIIAFIASLAPEAEEEEHAAAD